MARSVDEFSKIERVELDAPAIVEAVAHRAIDDIQRRRLKDAVLGERSRADVAPAQRAEPAGLSPSVMPAEATIQGAL